MRNFDNSWLADHERQARHDAIASYAAEIAGTELDLDRDWEAAGIESLARMAPPRK